MPAIPVMMLVAAAASTAMQVSSSRKAAQTAKNVAGYNAKVDEEQAKQNDIDTSENTLRQRKANQVYLSRQQSAIAANGLLAAGSPLDLMADTARNQEQDIQDAYRDSQVKDLNLYSAAEAGQAEGAASSSAYSMQGTASLFSGVSNMAYEANSAYGPKK